MQGSDTNKVNYKNPGNTKEHVKLTKLQSLSMASSKELGRNKQDFRILNVNYSDNSSEEELQCYDSARKHYEYNDDMTSGLHTKREFSNDMKDV